MSNDDAIALANILNDRFAFLHNELEQKAPHIYPHVERVATRELIPIFTAVIQATVGNQAGIAKLDEIGKELLSRQRLVPSKIQPPEQAQAPNEAHSPQPNKNELSEGKSG